MPYAILRFAKVKMGGVSAACAHDERTKEKYKSNPDVDLSRSDQNYHLAEPHRTYRRDVQEHLRVVGCKVRSNSTVMVETLITASPEFMNALTAKRQHEFFQRAFNFITKKVGEENIISAIVHMDEKTPHMHLSFVPITPDKRLSAKELLGNQAKLSQWQTDFHNVMSKQWPELERGISSRITRRKHIPIWLFKQAERLDKKFDEVASALSDINVFNAGKKRDKALDTLAKWVPEAERFTAQLKTVDKYIAHLENQVIEDSDRRGDYSANMQKSSDKLKKADWEIYELRRKLEQTERMLDRIPDDVLAQYSRNHQSRGMER